MTTTNSDVTCTCDHCGVSFMRKQWQVTASIKRGRTKQYCSRECALAVQMKKKKSVQTDWTKQIGANKEYCPSCGEKALTIIYTTKNKLGHRYRRKECRNCSERFTTYEVPIEYYNSLTTKKEQANVCFSCIHNDTTKCSLGIPEYKTAYSSDCFHATTE